jgi:hypothetical protein
MWNLLIDFVNHFVMSGFKTKSSALNNPVFSNELPLAGSKELSVQF